MKQEPMSFTRRIQPQPTILHSNTPGYSNRPKVNEFSNKQQHTCLLHQDQANERPPLHAEPGIMHELDTLGILAPTEANRVGLKIVPRHRGLLYTSHTDGIPIQLWT